LKSCENGVAPQSDYYVYSPSQNAKNMFFYPLYTGCFVYEAGYDLYRDSYDSFLLMYIRQGHMILKLDGNTLSAGPGCFALIDCYGPHAYGTREECTCLWLHFDGPTARMWYQAVCAHLGNVFTLMDCQSALKKMEMVYKTFQSGEPVREPLISQYINDILTSFLLSTLIKTDISDSANRVEKAISYINDHFTENITVERIADSADMSLYHFIRVFKRETGFTPHKYLTNVRLNAAKYLLKNSNFSIKDVCFNIGFSCESVFCSAFKKQLGITPMEYRTMNSD